MYRERERERVYSSGGGGKRLFSIEGKKKAAAGEVFIGKSDEMVRGFEMEN